MTRRRLLLIGPPAAFVVLGVGAWLLWPRTAITWENASKIREGMTLAEVETLLGGPARDETTGPVVPADTPEGWFLLRERMPTPERRAQPEAREWTSEHLMTKTWFDAEDRVVVHAVLVMRRADENPLDMLRRWLRL